MLIRTPLLFLFVCFVICANSYAGDAEKLIGVWERVSGTPLTLILTKSYFSTTYSAPDRMKLDKPLVEMSKLELRDLLRFACGYGTYKVTGNELIRHHVFAGNPNLQGADIVDEFSFYGNRLALRRKADPRMPPGTSGSPQEWRFRRLE